MEDGPRMARPWFASLLPGGKQEFPNDPIADNSRDERLRAEGKIVIRRRPKEVV